MTVAVDEWSPSLIPICVLRRIGIDVHVSICLYRRGLDRLTRKFARRITAQQIHVKKAILSVNKTSGKGQIISVLRGNRRDTGSISFYRTLA